MDYSSLINGTEEQEIATMSLARTGDPEETWIKNLEYIWSDVYEDTQYSEVLTDKSIKLDENQVNLAQESYGQFIPFKMARKYDGLDLATNTSINIHYVRKHKEEDELVVEDAFVEPINVEYSETELRFGWLISNEVTSYVGAIDFEIVITGVNDIGNDFTWKSKPSKGDLKILESLTEGNPIEISETWRTELVNAFVEAATEQIGLGNYYTKTETDLKLEDYATTTALTNAGIDDVTLTLGADDYKLTLTLKDKAGNEFQSNEIDLPIESLVVGVTYDEDSKDLTIQLKNGESTTIALDDIIDASLNSYYTKTEIDTKLGDLGGASVASYVASAISSEISTAVEELTETINGAVGTINGAISTIEGKITTIEGEISTIEDEIETLDGEIDAVDGKIGELKNGDDTYETVVGYVTGTVYTKTVIDSKLGTLERDGEDVSVQEYVDSIDISGRLGDLGKKIIIDEETDEEVEVDKTVKEYVDDKIGELEIEDDTYTTVVDYVSAAIDKIDVTEIVYSKEEVEQRLGNLGTKTVGEGDEQQTVSKSVQEFVEDKIGNLGTAENVIDYVDTALEDLNTSKLGNYYTKNETDSAINTKLASELNAYATKAYVDSQVAGTSSSQLTYDISYNNPEAQDGGENVFVFYEVENEGKEGQKITTKQRFTISGGTGTGGVLKINYVTNTPIYARDGNDIVIEYKFEGTDPAGDPINNATAVWKVGSRVVSTEEITSLDETTGEIKINKFNITNFLNIGTQKVTLTVTDDSGNLTSKTWTVTILDIRITSSFNDTQKWNAGETIPFSYVPYGAIEKIVHIVFDGVDNKIPLDKTITGTTQPFTIPAKPHGAYPLEAYITTTVNGADVRSDSIYKDIIFFNPLASRPIISTIYRNFEVDQYDTFTIPITVYDPNSAAPVVNIYIDEEYVETKTLIETNTFSYDYKESVPGDHKIKLVCGDATEVLNVTVKKLDITVNPILAGLAFDFDPSKMSNEEGSRDWKYNDVTMDVSPNFDWINGGYHKDENGDQYFRVKAGTWAKINHNIFYGDAKENGREFKVVFKTENIRARDTVILSSINDGIGLEMKVEEANIYSNNGSLYSPYSEEEIIEFEFNINGCKFTDDGKISDGVPLVLTYEDGVANRPMVYTKDSSFWQTTAQPITIGSNDCDILIYRMKAYTNSLEDNEILVNFIADARNASEMVRRYNRNQIYNTSNELDAETLAKACPDLRVIMIEAPVFTNDKENKVENTTITMRYENGDKYLDNWVCVNALHSGQGTSSNDYGYSGRNLDLIMNEDNSLFTFGDGSTGTTITLTRDSVPTNYLNVKVNIASSENANNALMAERYNRFNPFKRVAKLNNSKVKDTMEFYNCVIFIKENSTTEEHREFNDTNWHFYGIGNVGDSKKTDKTRVNDKNDVKECVVEIMDYNVSLAEFPTGYQDGYTVCPPELWTAGNTAYDQLHGLGYEITIGEGEKAVTYDPNGYTYKKGIIKKFGYGSYEFRYEKSGITLEQQAANINAWRELYRFIVTSDDETFKRDFEKYFVLDSALYFYLFTERYTMVDNRAKNSFWHYGKTYFSSTDDNIPAGIDSKYIDDTQAAFNDGYRWDLTFGYDFDTSLGIDNTGKLVLTYGKEDTDQYSDDGTDTRMIYRAAKSNFFVRLRENFASEMESMFKSRESAGAWSAESLIKQWDDSQAQFPEELWRLDIQRKYVRTFTGRSIDGSIPGAATERFLAEMLNGRKKYQRRMFERNQEMYMATKYFGTTATNDKITLRFNNPETYELRPDFTLRITPYSDMYIGIQPGATTPTNVRAKAGVEYTIPYPIASATADITNIYGAKFIQAIGDLSAAYVGDNDLSKATRLQSISIGTSIPKLVENLNGYVTSIGSNGNYEYGFTPVNTGVSTLYTNIKIKEITTADAVLTPKDFDLEAREGVYYIVLKKQFGNVTIDSVYSFNVEYDAYFNSYMKKLALGNNALLQYLDIRNVTGLEQAVDLSRCNNLVQIKAEGAGATGIVFANGGRLQRATLPKIKTLTAKNLNEIISFEVASYEDLQSLIVENTPKIDTYKILTEAKDLRILRLVGIDWPKSLNIQDGEILDRALKMRGNNASGVEIEQSVIIGTAHIISMRQKQIDDYDAAWPNLSVTYDRLINQYYARFYNGLTVVDTQLVDEGQVAVDPINREVNPIPTPTKDSTVKEQYEFSGWSPENFDPMYSDKKYEAQFTPSPMEYTITYTGLGVEPYSRTVNYGVVVEYPYGTPKYSSGANMYYLFKGWDKSGYANQNKTITAQYDTCSYYDGYFKEKELNELTPVELLMLVQTAGTLFTLKDDTNYLEQKEIEVPFGNDFICDSDTDIQNKELISEEIVFDGVSKRKDTNEILMDGNTDFVLAVDFKRSPDTKGSTIFQSYNPGSSAGFRVNCSETETQLVWGTTQIALETGSKFDREMLVLRHKAGEKKLYVYFSQKNKQEILCQTMESLQAPVDALSLVFGCRKNTATAYSNYAAGSVYWSKVWYGDLGDEECKRLASWPHERKVFITCSADEQTPDYGTDKGVATLVFLAKYATNRTFPLGTDWSNKGGWAAQQIRTYLEDKYYKGINEQFKSLINLTKVKAATWTGDQYNSALVTLGETNDHIFIPARVELQVFGDYDGDIQKMESTTFDDFDTNEKRVCYTEDGTLSNYWTRTINKSGDWGFYVIEADGRSSNTRAPYEEQNLRLMFTL